MLSDCIPGLEVEVRDELSYRFEMVEEPAGDYAHHGIGRNGDQDAEDSAKSAGDKQDDELRDAHFNSL